MKQNNIGKKLKAAVAVVLMIASLFALTSVVSAGIVERILGDEYISLRSSTSSSQEEKHECEWNSVTVGDFCKKCNKIITRQYEECSICKNTRNDTGWSSCDCATTTRSN